MEVIKNILICLVLAAVGIFFLAKYMDDKHQKQYEGFFNPKKDANAEAVWVWL